MSDGRGLILWPAELAGPGEAARLPYVAYLRGALVVAVGLILARLAARAVQRLARDRLAAHPALLARRCVFYGLFGLFLVAGLREAGFELRVLLGAAGILSVALGFASQTSASNIISGLFLLFEQPFQIGDQVEVSGTTGEVLSVDLLSVKLRTSDNRFVRIPNETVIKSQVVNLTRFPVRRVDVQLGIAYDEDVERVRRVLGEVARKNPLCLEHPEPEFFLGGFGAAALDVQFCPWVRREHYVEVKNSLPDEIKRAFAAHGIDLPHPHVPLLRPAAAVPPPTPPPAAT